MAKPPAPLQRWRRLVGGWQSVPGQWPRRLLHIPSMTSIERKPDNYYLKDCEPEYSILTYTWGRWHIKDGPSLVVKGLDWDIPAVDEHRAFTVAAFERVVEKMGESTTWAWIDVACIDQDKYNVKMDEIGRQAGIFANATRVYAWLWRLPGSDLQAALDNIVQCSVDLTPHDVGPAELGRDTFQMLNQLNTSTQDLLGDWWFSSLWTLQEGILRRDATLMGRDGQSLQHEISGSASDMLCRYVYSSLWHVHQQLTVGENKEAYEAPPLDRLVDAITRRITLAGYSIAPFATNPNLQYAAAASRVASFDLDRIYGILSIYNLQVGSTVIGRDQSYKYTFDELEDEFASTLNASSPLLGQMFVHTRAPRKNRSWQITQQIRIPSVLNTYTIHDDSTRIDSKIVGTTHGYAQIEGVRCGLRQLSTFWRTMNEYKLLYVAVDDYMCKWHTNLPHFGDVNYPNPNRHTQDAYTTVDALLREFQEEDLTVFLLGRRDIERPLRDPNSVGLLLLHSSQDTRRCERLGVCVWDTRAEGFPDGEAAGKPVWVPFEGVLH